MGRGTLGERGLVLSLQLGGYEWGKGDNHLSLIIKSKARRYQFFAKFKSFPVSLIISRTSLLWSSPSFIKGRGDSFR